MMWGIKRQNHKRNETGGKIMRKNNVSEFETTKRMFADACKIYCDPKEMAFAEWNRLPEDLKAAGLYVRFYSQIYLAWMKTKCEFTESCDAVSTVMQYLMKNVPIIENCSAKFAEAYLYTVSYNALLPLSRLIKTKWMWENRDNKVLDVHNNGNEVDPYDDLEDESCDIDRSVLSRDILRLIDSLTEEQVNVLDGILNRKRVYDRNKTAAITKELRQIFQEVHDRKLPADCTITFGDIVLNEDVESATVLMPDGESAFYDRAFLKNQNGSIRVSFYGAERDYVFTLARAAKLQVLDIEWH
jgi:hypothetical protein